MKNSEQNNMPLAKTDNRGLTQRLAEKRALRNPSEFVRFRANWCGAVRTCASPCESVQTRAFSCMAVRPAGHLVRGRASCVTLGALRCTLPAGGPVADLRLIPVAAVGRCG